MEGWQHDTFDGREVLNIAALFVIRDSKYYVTIIYKVEIVRSSR